MHQKFVLALTKHSQLGLLLKPYIVEPIEKGYYNIIKNILAEKLDNKDYTPNQNKLIKLALQCSEQEIYRIFSKEEISVFIFMKKLKEDEKLQKIIHEYIKKRILACFEILLDAEDNIELFYTDTPHKISILDQLNLEKEEPQIIFNFQRNQDGIKYFLSVKHKDNLLNLYGKKYKIINNLPCLIIINKKVYFFINKKEVTAKKLQPFFVKKYIEVPQRSEKEYFNTFIKKTVENSEVNAEGFSIDTVTIEPLPVLTLEKNWQDNFILILKFDYYGNMISSNNPRKSFVELKNKNNQYSFTKTLRNHNFEQDKINILNNQEDLKADSSNSYKIKPKLSETIDMLTWLNSHSELLKDYGFNLKQHFHKKKYFIDKISLELNLEESKDWFNLYGIVHFGSYKVPFIRLKNYLLNGIKEYILPNNEIAILPNEWFEQYATIIKMGKIKDNILIINKIHSQYLGEYLEKIDQKLINKANVLKHLSPKVPSNINAKLRDYQIFGYQWLYSLYSAKLGACLADDMGLGKTLQTLAFIIKIKTSDNQIFNQNNKPKTPIQLSLFDALPEKKENTSNQNAGIIVMPKSLLHNWENEIRKFTPQLRCLQYNSKNCIKYICDFNDYDIILTSYGTLRNNIEFLSNYYYQFAILDESQFVKNPESKTYLSVSNLKAEFKMVLTGTPIENSLIDLWSQLNFINKGLLGDLEFFKKEFVNPIAKSKDEELKLQKQKNLKKLINPFILRRKKDEVLQDLPELTENVYYCSMTEEQQKLYEIENSRIRNKLLTVTDNHSIAEYNILVIRALLRLRQLANHPKLINFKDEYDDLDETMLVSSGKFDEVIWTIENLISENNKVLIFSSFVKHLDLFADYFDDRKWKYSKLIGKTTNREAEIAKFNEQSDNLLFLISLKAGGVGLNLASANYVLFLDPWWNPAAENQAISRAHRMGQKNKVIVYRFITENSIEQKILNLQKSKKQLSKTFIDDSNPFKQFTKEEILELF